MVGKNQVHGVGCGGVKMFDHCGTVLQLLLWPRIPPHVLGLYIPCGLVHLMLAGGLKIFMGQMVVISGNINLQCGCMPVVLIGMMHHC